MVSLDEVHERLLRQLARELHGGKKGSLSAVVAAGINELAGRDRRMRAVRHQLALMEKGFDLGLGNRKAYENRGDIYD